MLESRVARAYDLCKGAITAEEDAFEAEAEADKRYVVAQAECLVGLLR